MTSKNLIEQFEQIGTTEIHIVQNETVTIMEQVFTKYSSKYFKQSDFVKLLNKSNPFVNHCLHKLLKSKHIERFGTKRLYLYRKVQ